MKAVLQRVNEASVTVDGDKIASIGKGLLILVGVEDSDTAEDIEWLAFKISKIRIFNDLAGVMNLSIEDIDGEIIVVSQFTLHAATRKGNRPSYIRAAKPQIAIPVYESFVRTLQAIVGKTIQTGRFGADMKVALLNDGPVTIIIDTKNRE